MNITNSQNIDRQYNTSHLSKYFTIISTYNSYELKIIFHINR